MNHKHIRPLTSYMIRIKTGEKSTKIVQAATRVYVLLTKFNAKCNNRCNNEKQSVSGNELITSLCDK